MPSNFRYADDAQMARRQEMLARFVNKMVEPETGPVFVSDQATVFDVVPEMPAEIISMIKANFGVELTVQELQIPFWQLLDRVRP